MRWIGLTGGIATGKSTASRIFRELGVPVIDADILAKDAVQIGTPAFKEIVRAFGPGVVGADGSLDRKALGAIVFNAKDKLLQLESIIHPEVKRLQREARTKVESQGHKVAIYDVPLLFEKNLEKDYDATIVIACSMQTQLHRLMKRDQISEQDAKLRISSQLPIGEKIKRATHVVMNDKDEAALKKAITELLPKL